MMMHGIGKVNINTRIIAYGFQYSSVFLALALDTVSISTAPYSLFVAIKSSSSSFDFIKEVLYIKFRLYSCLN